MKKILLFLIFTSVFCPLKIHGQKGFRFQDPKLKKQRVSFSLINNLIVLPVEINGKTLSFILDSGVSKTILFNLSQNDSIGLKNVKKVTLQGLGNGTYVKALLSKKNRLSIKSIVNRNQTIYVIFKDFFDLSSKMGTTIHGIIGYNILKDFIVKINYKSKKIDFYNPEKYSYKVCKKCEVFPLKFFRRKPYVYAKVQLDTIGNQLTDVKLLIDSGGSDAIWLFENSKENIKTPKRYFNDILGEGLSGTIYGNRSRIPRIKLGAFTINKPTVSFLDSLSTHNARLFKERNGSIGAEILKRFDVWFDYPKRKMMLKKRRSFTAGFNYNMSGLDVIYAGKQLVREKQENLVKDSFNITNQSQKNNSIRFITRYSFKFKPTFKIKNVVKNSPAYKAGLLKNDIILKINGDFSNELTLSQIVSKFQERNNKLIKMVVERNGKEIKFEFRLKKRI